MAEPSTISRRHLRRLSDVPPAMVDYFTDLFGANLRAVFVYGSSLLRDVDNPIAELTRSEFEDKRCDFILVLESLEDAFGKLGSHWPNWTSDVASKMVELSRTLGGRIVYFVPETVRRYEIEFRDPDDGEKLEVHSDYQVPYKFGVLRLADFRRDLSSERRHFYIAGRASKWGERNLLYAVDENFEKEVRDRLGGLRLDLATLARHLSPVGAPLAEILLRYFSFSYLCEAWRLDFMSKPEALVKGLGEEIRQLVTEAIRETPPVLTPDRRRRRDLLRMIFRGNWISMRMSLGNSRSNRFSYSPHRMAGNKAYVGRKLRNILPDILMLPIRMPLFAFRIVRWRFFGS